MCGSRFARGVITAVYWLSPPVYPVKVVGSRAEALEWLEPMFEAALAEFPDGPAWAGRRGFDAA